MSQLSVAIFIAFRSYLGAQKCPSKQKKVPKISISCHPLSKLLNGTYSLGQTKNQSTHVDQNFGECNSYLKVAESQILSSCDSQKCLFFVFKALVTKSPFLKKDVTYVKMTEKVKNAKFSKKFFFMNIEDMMLRISLDENTSLRSVLNNVSCSEDLYSK